MQRNIVVRNMLARPVELVISHNGRRVQGGEDVHFVPGSILQVTGVLTGNPPVVADSTGEPASSLEQSSHSTWTSMPHLSIDTETLQSGTESIEHTLDWIPGSSPVLMPHATAANSAVLSPTAVAFFEQEERDLDENSNDEVRLLQGWVSLAINHIAIVGSDRAGTTESHFAAQTHELTWFPDEDQDWIATVVRRSTAVSLWEFSRCITVLRPEEHDLQVPLDVRAVWRHPDHFDLANILWTTWPDLNHVRFSLHEVRSLYRLDQQDDMITVLVRPHRWGSSVDARSVNVEVVRLQWGSLISRQTAVLSSMKTTPRRIAELCKIRDCSVFLCEVYLEGHLMEPDSDLRLRNGDLVTVVVSNEEREQWTFRIGNIPLYNHWDTRRWRSQEQIFQQEGTVSVLRPVVSAEDTPSNIRIQVRTWYNWQIVIKLVEEQWSDFRYVDVIKYDVDGTWRRCPEFQSNMGVVILMPDPPPMLTRVVVVICRNVASDQMSFWSQVLETPTTETDLVALCGYLDVCKQCEVVCDPSWNGRPIRFAQHLSLEDGDILTLEARKRQPFCNEVEGSSSTLAEASTLALLQLHVHTSRSQTSSPWSTVAKAIC